MHTMILCNRTDCSIEHTNEYNSEKDQTKSSSKLNLDKTYYNIRNYAITFVQPLSTTRTLKIKCYIF